MEFPVQVSSVYERQKLAADFFVVSERAENRACGHHGVLLFNAAHHHAEMAAFHDNAHALGAGGVQNGRGDFLCKPFLDLQAPCEAIDYSCEFADAQNLAVRNVSYGATAVERQKMVFAHGVYLNVSEDDHVVRAACENCVVDDRARTLSHSASKE